MGMVPQAVTVAGNFYGTRKLLPVNTLQYNRVTKRGRR